MKLTLEGTEVTITLYGSQRGVETLWVTAYIQSICQRVAVIRADNAETEKVEDSEEGRAQGLDLHHGCPSFGIKCAFSTTIVP